MAGVDLSAVDGSNGVEVRLFMTGDCGDGTCFSTSLVSGILASGLSFGPGETAPSLTTDEPIGSIDCREIGTVETVSSAPNASRFHGLLGLLKDGLGLGEAARSRDFCSRRTFDEPCSCCGFGDFCSVMGVIISSSVSSTGVD